MCHPHKTALPQFITYHITTTPFRGRWSDFESDRRGLLGAVVLHRANVIQVLVLMLVDFLYQHADLPAFAAGIGHLGAEFFRRQCTDDDLKPFDCCIPSRVNLLGRFVHADVRGIGIEVIGVGVVGDMVFAAAPEGVQRVQRFRVPGGNMRDYILDAPAAFFVNHLFGIGGLQRFERPLIRLLQMAQQFRFFPLSYPLPSLACG